MKEKGPAQPGQTNITESRPDAGSEVLHVGRPNIGDRGRLLERINEMLDSRWLTNNGPMVQEFERRLEAVTGARHCIAVCNATIGLEIAIRALGLKGEVIVPSFTFIATAHALQWQEITPVFCDIDPRWHLIDPGRIERLITPRTTGILGVHTWGRVADIDELEAIAKRRGLALLFDAAHAFGCSQGDRMVGRFGHCEVFSFHATKFLNAFEGGAIATDDDDLARKIRLMKNFGFRGLDDVCYIGTNGKMPEVSAAMGLTSLEAMTEFIEINRRNLEAYERGLSGLPGVRLLDYEWEGRSNYQYAVIEIDGRESRESRDGCMNALHAEGILARRYFFPGCHRMEPYRSYFPNASLLLPVTEEICSKVLVLPNGTAVGVEAVKRVCSVIEQAVRH